jgi:hypothetical protein
MNSYLRATPPSELSILELSQIECTRERNKQIRAAKVRMFFSDYESWRGSGDDDPDDLPKREHQLGITEAEWSEWHQRRREKEAAVYAANPF